MLISELPDTAAAAGRASLLDAATSAEPPSILSKAFDLLQAFAPDQRVMTLSELARVSALPKSTVHRLLARLVGLDAVEHHRGGYKLSLGLMRLGVTTPAGSMRDTALPHLASLYHWTGETVHLAVLRHFDAVYLERIARPDSPVSISGVGARLPANCTAIGKALLAWEDFEDLTDFLPSPMPKLTPWSVSDVDQLIKELGEIREHGLATERNQAQPGLACAAAPILVNGFAVGAVSVSHRADKALNRQVITSLRDCATRIARDVRAGLANGRSHWFPYDA
jgi:DNA-binding IclR family transcriptional regulator